MSLNWRTSGDCTADQWAAAIPLTSRIRIDGEVQACYVAAKGYTRLCLGMLAAESSFATNFAADSVSNNNALNLRIRGQSPFQTFPNWAAGITEWKARITDPNYAYAHTTTVLDLVSIYAPSSDSNDVDAYVRTVEWVMTRLGATSPSSAPTTGGTPVTDPNSLVFGRVPLPVVFDSYVLDSQTAAYDFLGQKTWDGVVWHRMEGTLRGTDGWFKRGRGISDGLTEFGVGTINVDGADDDGRILVWNPPMGDAKPGVSANRAPWASGPVSAPYGDGLAFLNDNGGNVNVVNCKEVAIEISGSYDDPVSAKAQASVAELTAYGADQKHIPWDQFPIIPGKGYSFVRWHQEICIGTGKECPGAVVINLTPALIELTRSIMKQWQTGALDVQTPAPPPKQPKFAKPHQVVTESEKVVPYGKKLTVIAEYQPRQVASEHGQPTGAVVPVTDPKTGKPNTIVAKWLMVAGDGTIWYVTAGGSRHPRWAFFKTPTNQAKSA